MKNIIAICIVAFSGLSATAAEVVCTGYRYGLRTHDLITLDISDQSARACDIQNTSAAWTEVGAYCNPDDYCAFVGHVSKHDGSFYTIDRVVGPITE